MPARHPRSAPARVQAAPISRGPHAAPVPTATSPAFHHAPNAALLIDFDNVTMGIQKDLHSELRNLLSSDIIKGKVAVQRAYADWRRYPQYIVPLTESSIDMIFAPAYGSSKKNATDIRLAVDAMELVFTRPEIGTYILLSGDSDFSSLVLKLKEYGKYVIGVGIRESSSDLLVMNCDEYFSYNALAGLVRAAEDETTAWDPWELVTEAIARMKRNGDVMRSDRLKQVMQEIDSSFDEGNLGMAKFSRFCQEAAQRGLIVLTKLDNGQLEVAPPGDGPAAARPALRAGAAEAPAADAPGEREERGRRGRRGGRGRGRGGDRGAVPAAPAAPAASHGPDHREPARTQAPQGHAHPPHAAAAAPSRDAIGSSGERLTKDEAFDVVRRAVAALATGNGAARASDVRSKAFVLLGHDSESLSERNFSRILRDAHDAEVIDLRRRGDDFEVALAVATASVADQLGRAEAAATPAPSVAPAHRGMVPRGIRTAGRSGSRGKAGAPPPELLMVGVVDDTVAEEDAAAEVPAVEKAPRKRGTRGRGTRGKGAAHAGAASGQAAAPDQKAPAARRRKPAAKKRAAPAESTPEE